MTLAVAPADTTGAAPADPRIVRILTLGPTPRSVGLVKLRCEKAKYKGRRTFVRCNEGANPDPELAEGATVSGVLALAGNAGCRVPLELTLSLPGREDTLSSEETILDPRQLAAGCSE